MLGPRWSSLFTSRWKDLTLSWLRPKRKFLKNFDRNAFSSQPLKKSLQRQQSEMTEEPKLKRSRSQSPPAEQTDQYGTDGDKLQSMSLFKKAFKQFKARRPPPSLKAVVDIHNWDKWIDSLTPLKANPTINCLSEPHWLLSSSENWKVFTLKKHPGLILIRDPFLAGGHLLWSRKCLRDYTSRQLCTTNIDPHIEPDSVIFSNKRKLERLRWSTLGYHYDWNQKIYTDLNKSPFPQDLADMTSYIAESVGFEGFVAEAAILNFYHLDSTLSGHVDQSEFNLDAPLISISLGQTAVFLLGGTTLDDEVTPLMLRCGDIMIMSGASRLCYHAVPKILKTDQPLESEDLEVVQYMGVNRINITVRQVNRVLV